ncbi:MAG: hypothetical protein DI537_37945 [Stutzerimonas stutzeri]|nr:MAG: hypothetical protein DI537_37945 [Stutzerimonas stutzeri]
MKPFDTTDRRCIFPKCGKIIDDAMRAKGFNNTSLAAKLGIDHTAVAGYRRGFSRPNDAVRIKLMERLLGVKLDMNEKRPSERRTEQVAIVAEAPPALQHLAAAALALGYKATFVPVSA